MHRLDAAHLYRLVLEKGSAGATFHGVAEEGVPFRDIAGVIGGHLNVPVVAKSPNEAADHFGWFAHFVAPQPRRWKVWQNHEWLSQRRSIWEYKRTGSQMCRGTKSDIILNTTYSLHPLWYVYDMCLSLGTNRTHYLGWYP